MSSLSLNTSTLGGALGALLAAPDIAPGDAPSYQTCKAIYSYHPLGMKISAYPVKMAMSQRRKIAVPKGPEERLVEAFEKEWKAIGADKAIFNIGNLARIYGAASLALITDGTPADRAVDFKAIADAKIAFNVFDPLNTAGSLILNQDPNSIDFQKILGIAVQGTAYHRSRTVTLLNEDPIYIDYTVSAFGYVGRSVYQRGLYPLKSYLNTMITDDMVARKAGLLIAKMQQQSSVIDRVMATVQGIKRNLLKEAETDNVLSIAPDEEIASLDLTNLDGAGGWARKNIIDNIASACGTPAQILNAETFAEGFGEGTEDAKHVAQHIDGIRLWLDPVYDFFDQIVMYRAWNPEFYKTIQADFADEYGKMGYTQAFYNWRNSFAAPWPNLLEEPDSEKIKVEDVKLKAIIAAFEVFAPALDPENKSKLMEWAQDGFNENKLLFSSPLELDFEALANYEPPAGEEAEPGEPSQPRPFAASDSMRRLDEAISRLPERKKRA